MKHFTALMESSFKYTKNFIISLYYIVRGFFQPSKIKDARDIPIIINNFNRLSCLLELTEALTKRGYHNIYIIDNKSTYPPLLEYYENCPHTVFRLDKNVGFRALWRTDLRKRFCNDYYVYTDSDVIPASYCPDDFLDYFFRKLKEHPFARKVGFSLRLDNLPDYYAQKQEVIDWEKQHYTRMWKNGLYKTLIDTTFALYRPFAGISRTRFVDVYRTPYPYMAEHRPWYADTNNLTEEEKYYTMHSKTATQWTSVLQEQIAVQ